MKNLTHLIASALFVFLLASCNQDETLKPNSQPISYRDHCGTALTLTHPAEVNVDEAFNIVGTYACGRVSLERGYILADDEVTRIYTGLSCDDENLLWELLVSNACYTVDINQAVTLTEAGVHVFRTRHLSNDGNCDGLGGNNSSGNCSFNGTNHCCFEILAIDPCSNEITAEVTCDEDETCNRSVTFTFTAEEDGPVVVQGGLTAFTTICEASATGGLVRNLTHQSAGGPSNVTRWEGTVVGCEEYSVTISWTSTNDDEEITGEWTVKQEIDGDEVEIASICPLNCAGESAESCD